jgi:hypothetical protein
MSTKLKWTSQQRKINELIPAQYNPRRLTEPQEKQLTESIQKFDICDPIVINSDNKIIGGHQRIKVLKKQGVETVDVRVPSRQLTADEEKELNLRLNKNMGEWDYELLSEFDEEMLKVVGFSPDELDVIFPVEEDEKDDDVPEVREETTTKIGDIFQLGRHRVMCGDSTDAGSVAVLMDGKKADMVFTDPPYGINEKGDRSNRGGACKGNKLADFKDDTIDYAIKAFDVCGSLGVERQVWWGANYYCHHLPLSNNWFVWDKRVEDKQKDTQSDCELAWVKSKMVKHKNF